MQADDVSYEEESHALRAGHRRDAGSEERKGAMTDCCTAGEHAVCTALQALEQGRLTEELDVQGE